MILPVTMLKASNFSYIILLYSSNYYDGDIEGSDCACEWARACKSCDMGLFFVRKSLICNQSISFVAIYKKPFQLASGSESNVCG